MASAEFTTWLTGTLTAVNNANLDIGSLVEYLTGVLAADAASGDGADDQLESVREILSDFDVLAGAASTVASSPDTLAAEIVDAFNRLCAASSAASAGSGGPSGGELSTSEAEALAKVREMTVAAKQPASGLAAGGADPDEKRLILQAYANISDDDSDGAVNVNGSEKAAGGSGAGPSGAQPGLPQSISNREAMQSEEKLRRERMKLEHAQKLERERADREKQKKAKEARKESEKKRTQKQERRK